MRQGSSALLFVLMAVASCGEVPERAVLVRAGIDNLRLQCASIEGTRTTVCQVSLDSSQADAIAHTFSLRPLLAIEIDTLRQAAVLHAYPSACRAPLEAGSIASNSVRGIFGSPSQLFEPGSAIQYESLILVESRDLTQSCLVFELSYG
jgi:hypothetical protein